MSSQSVRCGCADRYCPVHRGGGCTNDAKTVIVRVDMEDTTGTPVCDGCARDALSVGIFTERPRLLGFHRSAEKSRS